jgi:hypothetical protein
MDITKTLQQLHGPSLQAKDVFLIRLESPFLRYNIMKVFPAWLGKAAFKKRGQAHSVLNGNPGYPHRVTPIDLKVI